RQITQHRTRNIQGQALNSNYRIKCLSLNVSVRCSCFVTLCFVYGVFAAGPPSSAFPANTFLPSGNTQVLALTVLDPSFARKPSMDSVSPSFRVSFLQPCRYNPLGAPPSTA